MTREEKKKAIDALKISVPVMAVTQEEFNDYIQTLNQVMDLLEQDSKTGHWVAIDEEPHEDYECDKCGYTISTYTANIEPHTEYKYCPNCGARMIEQKESEEV